MTLGNALEILGLLGGGQSAHLLISKVILRRASVQTFNVATSYFISQDRIQFNKF